MDRSNLSYLEKKERLRGILQTKLLEISKRRLKIAIEILYERDPLMMPSKKLIELRKEDEILENKHQNLKKRLDKLNEKGKQ